MKIRIFNNDGSDYCDYEGSLEEIQEACKERIEQANWSDGWSEVLSEV